MIKLLTYTRPDFDFALVHKLETTSSNGAVLGVYKNAWNNCNPSRLDTYLQKRDTRHVHDCIQNLEKAIQALKDC